MADKLNINNVFITEAVNVIVKERQRVGDTVVPKDIEAVVRSYINLGLEKKILDWAWNVGDENKDAIIRAVMDRTKKDYGFTPAYSKVYTDLDIIETQYFYGLINPMVAKPRAAQEDWEKKQEYSHSSSAGGPADTSLTAAINRVFGGISKGAEAALKGIGLDVNFIYIIIAIMLLILFITRR